MRHLLSELMSWMTHVITTRNSSKVGRAELKRWAQTEYGKDWFFAYNYMLSHNGRAPNYDTFRKELC